MWNPRQNTPHTADTNSSNTNGSNTIICSYLMSIFSSRIFFRTSSSSSLISLCSRREKHFIVYKLYTQSLSYTHKYTVLQSLSYYTRSLPLLHTSASGHLRAMIDDLPHQLLIPSTACSKLVMHHTEHNLCFKKIAKWKTLQVYIFMTMITHSSRR